MWTRLYPLQVINVTIVLTILSHTTVLVLFGIGGIRLLISDVNGFHLASNKAENELLRYPFEGDEGQLATAFR